MGSNPLKELISRIIYDDNLDIQLTSIEYSDIDGAESFSTVPLVACVLETNNIRCGDDIIPFHRINRVTYNSRQLYPFPDDVTYLLKGRDWHKLINSL